MKTRSLRTELSVAVGTSAVIAVCAMVAVLCVLLGLSLHLIPVLTEYIFPFIAILLPHSQVLKHAVARLCYLTENNRV